MKKIIISVIVAVILMTCFLPCCYAANGADDAIADGKEFINRSKKSRVNNSELQNFSDSMSNTLLLIGMVVAVIVGIILGIKFMISSVEDKAQIKEMLTIYVIGCAVLFGAFTIWKICVELFQSI